MKLAHLSFSAVLLLLTTSGEAVKAPPPASCHVGGCWFSIESPLRCKEVPANYRITMNVRCQDNIPRAAFPVLVDESGQSVASEWVKIWNDDPFEPDVGRFELLSPLLVEGEHYRIRGPVPVQCSVLYVTDPQEGELKLCPSPEGESPSCCTVYAEAGFQFIDDSPGHEDLSHGDDAGAAGQGGQGGASEAGGLAHEYLRFVAGPPDTQAPAAPTVRAECELRPTGNTFSAGLSLLADLDEDVRWVEVWVEEFRDQPPYRVAIFERRACSTGLASNFSPIGHAQLPWSYYVGLMEDHSGEWVMRAVALDHAGNTSEEQIIRTTVPDDCQEGAVIRELPSHQCTGPDYSALADCELPTIVNAPESLDALCDGFQSLYLPPLDAPVLQGQGGAVHPPIELDDEPAPELPFESETAAPPQKVKSNTEEASGCGCDLSRSVAPPGQGLLLLLASLVFWARRRLNSAFA